MYSSSRLSWIAFASTLVVMWTAAAPAGAKSKGTSQPPPSHRFYVAVSKHSGQPPTSVTHASTGLSQHAPFVPAGLGEHSVASLNVIRYNPDADARDIAEVGWRVAGSDPERTPRLFVAAYSTTGGCGSVTGCFVSRDGASIRPGDALPVDPLPPYDTPEYAIEHLPADPVTGSTCCAGWWVRYDGEWIGHLPDKLWYSKRQRKVIFTSGQSVVWQGEVASADESPCTDMGSGSFGIRPDAANFADLQVNHDLVVPTGLVQTHPELYNASPLSASNGPNGFRYGGPGAC